MSKSSQGEQTKQLPGRLRVYLGYAAGVGKTFRMLLDAKSELGKGTDLVIGYLEPHKREDTIHQATGIETVPRRTISYRERLFEEMDCTAIIRRSPRICLIDELAHTNVPGSQRSKRWEDVLEILSRGISVWTTVNIQHFEGLNDEIYALTGVRVRETMPDWLLKSADEVILADLTPEALLNRLRRGSVYPAETVLNALENFFRESNLVALRELALRQAAHQIDVTQASTGRHAPTLPLPMERIIAVVTAHPATASLLRRAKRLADYLQGDCLALFVSPSGDLSCLDGNDRSAVERHLQFARNLGIETRIAGGRDLARSVVEFARRNRASQIYVTRESYRFVERILRRNLVHRIVSLAPDMRVTVAAGAAPR